MGSPEKSLHPAVVSNQVTGHAIVNGHVFQAQNLSVTVVSPASGPITPTEKPAPPHPKGRDTTPVPPSPKAGRGSRKVAGGKRRRAHLPTRAWGPVPIGVRPGPGKDRSKLAKVRQPLNLNGSLVVGEGCRLHVLDAHDGSRRSLIMAADDSRPHADSGQLCFQGLNRQVNTYDLRTGKQHRWNPGFRLHEGMTSTSGGTAFTVGPDGIVTALDLLRRQRRWAMTEVACRMVSTPRAAEGHVIGLGSMKPGADRSVDCVAALHEEDGTGRWLHPTDAPLSEVWSASDRTVYVIEVVSPRMRLVAINMSTGADRWKSEWFEGAPADLTVAGGTAFLRTTEHQLHVVDTGDGRTRWSTVDITFSPTVADGRVFLVDNASRIAAVDLATGHDVWPRRPSKGTLLTTPFVKDGAVYTIGHIGLMTRDAATGRALAPPYPMSLSPDNHGMPVLLDGVLCFTNARREVEAVFLG
ncbi:outer membrane protein assembly factor BamB family protein [Kitasatospora sp. NPDC003701]